MSEDLGPEGFEHEAVAKRKAVYQLGRVKARRSSAAPLHPSRLKRQQPQPGSVRRSGEAGRALSLSQAF